MAVVNFAGARHILPLDSKGILHASRPDLDRYKKELAALTAPDRQGDLAEALRDADVFIGVARADLLKESDVRLMTARPVVFALSNPVPEIMPDAARHAGAAVVATGRSDYPNQIYNALVFPGIFRGALDNGVKDITETMQIAAARKLAALIKKPSANNIIPKVFDKRLVRTIVSAVRQNSRQK